MDAEKLVYRMVSAALADDDPRGSLNQLAGALYDCASAAHGEWAETPRTDELARSFVMQSLREAGELRGLAGYVQRVADATPEPLEGYCPRCWCERDTDDTTVRG